ncbi:LysE family translocator [Acidimicrobiaceae bacterium AH-315-P05]|nr:LysE family translocator [Acidimicrobiaceae bacterium AH-315-P05]
MSVILIVTPGPSVLFAIGQALRLGRKAALTTVVANGLGFWLQVILVAVGAGAFLERSSGRLTALQLCGGGYLIWIGVRGLAKPVDARNTPTPMGRVVFKDGFIVGVTNPKSLVFFVAVLPNHVDAAGGFGNAAQMVILGAVFVLLAIVFDGAWAIGAGKARNWFAGSDARMRRLSVVGALMMAFLGAFIGFTAIRDSGWSVLA